MKTPLQIIKKMVKDYPNDMELGARVRWYIRWLYKGTDKEKHEDRNQKWSI